MRPDFTVDKLKSIALKHFYGDEGVKSSAKYYLVHVSKCTKLTGEHTVKDAEISNAGNACDVLKIIINTFMECIVINFIYFIIFFRRAASGGKY